MPVSYKGPMVGRENELERLLGFLGQSLSSEGGLVLIAGEVGSGKTTLCEALEYYAVKSGCQIMVGRCVPGARSPHLPFMEALYGIERNPFGDADSLANANIGSLFFSVLESIDGLSKTHPLVLRLEDLHWADSASIALMHFLGRNSRAMRILIVGTYRPEDLHPDASGETHPLKESLRVMRREGIVREIELGPLESRETSKMVPQWLGGEAEQRLVDLVANESNGNPLFAVEIMQLLVGTGQASLRDGMWRLNVEGKVEMPSTIRDVILARIEKLPSQSKLILDSASVVGERFDPELVARSIGVELPVFWDSAELLEREFRLIKNEGKMCSFSHDKIRQVVYDEIPKPRKSRIHKTVGMLLEEKLPDEELLAPLSIHFDRAGDTERCIKYALLAGEYCAKRRAKREAKTFLQLVLSNAASAPGHDSERLEALEGLGDLGFDVSTIKEWWSYYEKFLELNRDKTARARVLAKAAECWDQTMLRDTRKANELLGEAESLAEGNDAILAEVEHRRAELCANDGHPQEALVHLDIANKRYGSAGDSYGALRCRILEVYCLHQMHRFREAKAREESLVTAAKSEGDPVLLLEAQTLCACVDARMGETQSARERASEVVNLAETLGQMWWWRVALRDRARAFELDGDLESARRDALRALENARECEIPFHIATFQIDLGLYEAEMDMLESSNARYEEASRLSESFDMRMKSNLDAGLTLLRAELLSGVGVEEECNRTFEQVIIKMQDLGKLNELVNCRSRYALSLTKRGRPEEAKRQFAAAADVARAIGCETKVRAFEKLAAARSAID